MTAPRNRPERHLTVVPQPEDESPEDEIRRWFDTALANFQLAAMEYPIRAKRISEARNRLYRLLESALAFTTPTKTSNTKRKAQ